MRKQGIIVILLIIVIGILGTYIYTNMITQHNDTINDSNTTTNNFNNTNNNTSSVVSNGSTNTVTHHPSTTTETKKSDLQKQYDSGNVQSVTKDYSVEGPPITIVEYNDGSEGEYDNQGNYIGDQ